MKRIYILLLLALSAHPILAQPRIVVGIVVDQMRYEFLYRFQEHYTENGFKRLLKNGSNFTHAHYNYVPTHTAPGHTSIYTGSMPAFHGIIANDWYNKEAKKRVYCVDDDTYHGVGGSDKMSPMNLMASTITDQLRLSNNGRSKVIAVSLKDRGAILPGGRLANAAYWYHSENGSFITSDYYMHELPQWVVDFNLKKRAHEYAAKEWTTLFPVEQYKNNLPDETALEPDPFFEGRTSFPHSLKNIKEDDKLEFLRATPFGNELLNDFTQALLKNEDLGTRDVTDFLAVSFSSTDYVGHLYGPSSVEVYDTYVRLDRNIASLLTALDEKFGKDNYLVFLTADHGCSEIQDLINTKVKSAFNPKTFLTALKRFTLASYNSEGIVSDYINKQVYLNDSVIAMMRLNKSEVCSALAQFIRSNYKTVLTVFTRDELQNRIASRESFNPLLNGFNTQRSGDVILELNSLSFFESATNKSTHNTMYSYDTHVPMVFYGWHIKAEEQLTPVYITDIAPTIANLLKITEPSACVGIPLLK